MLTGYDHLLFLFGVVFFLSTFRDVCQFVTVFTIGHCITLIFATYFKITWNYLPGGRHHRAERDVQGVRQQRRFPETFHYEVAESADGSVRLRFAAWLWLVHAQQLPLVTTPWPCCGAS